MSSVATSVPPQAIQTEPTQAGQPPIQPVQPRNSDGTFAPQAVQPPTQQANPPAPAAPPVTPASDAPYSVVDIGNGQVEVRFKDLPEIYRGTQAEILPKVADALYNTKKWAQSQRQPAPQPVQAPAPPSPWATPEEKAAADQLMDLTAKGLGLRDGNELRERMGFITQTTEESASRDLSINFMAQNPDFNATEENSQKLTGIIATMVPSDEAWARMPASQQLSIMRAAHATALHTKAYAPTPAQQAPASTPSGPVPPPVPPTQSAPRDEFAGVPQDLIPTINDSQAVILQKIAKLKERGLWQ